MTPKELAHVLHTFMCDYFHVEDPTMLGRSTKCEWEIEECLPNKWEQEEHSKWLLWASQILREHPLLVSSQIRGYLELRVTFPKVYDLLIKIEEDHNGTNS